MKSLLLVIPTYNHLDYAEQAIVSAFANTTSVTLRVIVLDDASPDWSDDWLRSLRGRYGSSLSCHRFERNGGLLRSWNYGLAYARDSDSDFACVANSDLLFPRNWEKALLSALVSGWDLVGPLTNTPGTEPQQYAAHYSRVYRPGDAFSTVQEIQDDLFQNHAGAVVPATLNGFCLVAKTQTWQEHRHSMGHVFNPRNDYNAKGERNPTPLMTLGEYELQRRWKAEGLRAGICLGSYVYHYRSVSRGPKYARGDWHRRPEKAA